MALIAIEQIELSGQQDRRGYGLLRIAEGLIDRLATVASRLTAAITSAANCCRAVQYRQHDGTENEIEDLITRRETLAGTRSLTGSKTFCAEANLTC